MTDIEQWGHTLVHRGSNERCLISLIIISLDRCGVNVL